MSDLKQKLEAAARREAKKQIGEYVDMGHFRKPEEATPYLVDGFNQGHHSLHPQIIKLVEALGKVEDRAFLDTLRCECCDDGIDGAPCTCFTYNSSELLGEAGKHAREALAEFHAALEEV